MIKKITSAVLAGCMMMSVMAVGSFTTQAAETDTTSVSASTGYNASDEIQQGQVLQCWNWSYKNIEANMEKISSQGFSTIQTSPIQPSNMESNNNTVADRWWTFYQPTNFKINTESRNGLGTKDDFMQMCETAHSYGIKVIVDAVLNHMASQTTNDVCLLVPTSIRNDSDYWHSFSKDVTDYNDRKNVTQDCLYGLPDLNTQNEKVQNSAITYLKECIDAGADGFRFDAAKHIETPLDSSAYSSDFWPNVINSVTTYANSTRSITPYYYGEILGNVDNGNLNGYTNYIKVTDDARCNSIRAAVSGKNGGGAADSSIAKGVSPTKVLQWNESHDDYINNITSSVSTKVLNQTWAIIGSRAQVCSMYFARPENTTTTKIGDADVTGWANAEVKAVNDFKNYFKGQSEYLGSNGSIAYNERGTSGVVIANCNGGSATVNLTAHKMASGTYYDAVTGNKFTVSNGQISGTVGSTGVAVVYNYEEPTTSVTTGTTSTTGATVQTTTQSATGTTSSNTIYFKPSTNWKEANARFAAYVWTGSTNVWVSLADTDGDGTYSADLGNTTYTNVIFARMNPATTENNWNNKWNQTADLTIPSDKNCFEPTAGVWDNGNGTWNYIGAPTEPTEATAQPTTATTATTTQVVTTTQKVTTAPTTAVPTTTQKVTEPTEATTTPVSANTIYFVPSTNWKEASARFAVYAWTGSNSVWKSLSDTDGDGKYTADLDAAYENVIFCRMNPATTDNNWNNKWNQTADLAVPSGMNCFTVNAGEWNNASGTWSYIAAPTQPTTVATTAAPTTTKATTVPTTAPTTVPTTAPSEGVSVFGDINVALSSEDGVVYTGSTDLQIGTYTFKMNVNGKTYCCGSTFNDVTRDALYKSVYKTASTLNSTGGTHTFSYNTSTNKLTITFKAFSLASVFGDINMDLERSNVANVYSGKVTLEAGQYSFRIMNQDVQFCCGYTFNNVTKNSQYRSVYKNASILNADGGIYTFNYDVVTNLLTITYVPFGAKASVIGDISLVLDETETANVYSGTIDLAAGTYQFKMDFAGKTFCKGTTFKDAATGLLYKSVFTSYSNFVATGGTYTFTYNTETNRLSVVKVG